MSKTDVLNKLSEIKTTLNEKYNIVELGLFGSFSRGDYSENSDIDILVEYSKTISLFKLAELIEYLESVFNKKIDLVRKKNIKDSLKNRILDEVVFV